MEVFCYIMNKNEIANNIVKESLTDALFTLMSKKEFNDITITELSKKAGVSRLSFYRNYTSKEEIIVKYLDDKANQWWEKQISDKSGDVILEMFNHFYSERDKLAIIYKAGLSHLLYQNIFDCSGPSEELENKVAYTNGWVSGGIFGFVDEWIKRGFKESPKELANIFKNRKDYYTNMDMIENSYLK